MGSASAKTALRQESRPARRTPAGSSSRRPAKQERRRTRLYSILGVVPALSFDPFPGRAPARRPVRPTCIDVGRAAFAAAPCSDERVGLARNGHLEHFFRVGLGREEDSIRHSPGGRPCMIVTQPEAIAIAPSANDRFVEQGPSS
jgi:hypothetical protein